MKNPNDYLNGVDVCADDGEIDWDGLRESGALFCMVRASTGETDSYFRAYNFDPSFEKNLTDAYMYGFRVGAYHYLTAETAAEAISQAKGFIKALHKVGSKLNFYCAVVCPERYACHPDDMAMCLDVFCDKVAEEGYFPLIYASVDFLDFQNLSHPYWVPYTGNPETLSDKILNNMVLLEHRCGSATCDSGKLMYSALLDPKVLFQPIFNRYKIPYPAHYPTQGRVRTINDWAIRNGILPVEDKVSEMDEPIRTQTCIDLIKRFMDYYMAAYGDDEEGGGV